MFYFFLILTANFLIIYSVKILVLSGTFFKKMSFFKKISKCEWKLMIALSRINTIYTCPKAIKCIHDLDSFASLPAAVRRSTRDRSRSLRTEEAMYTSGFLFFFWDPNWLPDQLSTRNSGSTKGRSHGWSTSVYIDEHVCVCVYACVYESNSCIHNLSGPADLMRV